MDMALHVAATLAAVSLPVTGLPVLWGLGKLAEPALNRLAAHPGR